MQPCRVETNVTIPMGTPFLCHDTSPAPFHQPLVSLRLPVFRFPCSLVRMSPPNYIPPPPPMFPVLSVSNLAFPGEFVATTAYKCQCVVFANPSSAAVFLFPEPEIVIHRIPSKTSEICGESLPKHLTFCRGKRRRCDERKWPRRRSRRGVPCSAWHTR